MKVINRKTKSRNDKSTDTFVGTEKYRGVITPLVTVVKNPPSNAGDTRDTD